ELGLRNNTLVIFTTDNGPWNNMQEPLRKKHKGAVAWGSSGPLREGKGSTWEGGVRVPCIIRWPDHVPAARVSNAIFSTVDFMPTLAELAGCEVPKDRIIDGVDQTALLLGTSEAGARDHIYYFCQNEMHGVRKGKWKLLLPNRRRYYNYVKDTGSSEMELYNLESDLGEKHNLAGQHPEIVSEMLELVRDFRWPAKLPDTALIPKK
ncbi:MAG: sulfatase-like hydrolase/transferase, partial [Planctomycetota bacterium]